MKGSILIDELEHFVLKDIDGVHRIIPLPNVYSSELGSLGTTHAALAYLIGTVENLTDIFQYTTIMSNYDSLRRKK